MASGTSKSRNSPRRILDILDQICADPATATAQKLSGDLDIPLATVYRWIEALHDARFIAAHPSGYYMPGERLHQMLFSSLSHGPEIARRRSILRDLASTLQETVSLAAPHGDRLIYFDRVESHWPLQLNLPIGGSLPLHCCASGKLYMSSLPHDTAMRLFQSITAKHSTARSITQPDKFAEELTRIRDTDFAIDDQEWFDDMIGAAVPIRSADGAFMASLSTHGLATRKSVAALSAEIPAMHDAADELGRCLLSS